LEIAEGVVVKAVEVATTNVEEVAEVVLAVVVLAVVDSIRQLQQTVEP
jgi:hypothetical protein